LARGVRRARVVGAPAHGCDGFKWLRRGIRLGSVGCVLSAPRKGRPDGAHVPAPFIVSVRCRNDIVCRVAKWWLVLQCWSFPHLLSRFHALLARDHAELFRCRRQLVHWLRRLSTYFGLPPTVMADAVALAGELNEASFLSASLVPTLVAVHIPRALRLNSLAPPQTASPSTSLSRLQAMTTCCSS
jgi:hypothetical protein